MSEHECDERCEDTCHAEWDDYLTVLELESVTGFPWRDEDDDE